jgi:hypothetical protein
LTRGYSTMQELSYWQGQDRVLRLFDGVGNMIDLLQVVWVTLQTVAI